MPPQFDGFFWHYFYLNLTLLWISGQWRSWKNSSHRGRGRLFWSKINPELYRMDRQCCSSWPVNVVPPPLSKTKQKSTIRISFLHWKILSQDHQSHNSELKFERSKIMFLLLQCISWLNNYVRWNKWYWYYLDSSHV